MQKQPLRWGVEDYITKPVEEKELEGVLKKVCDKIEYEKQSHAKKSEMRDRIRYYTLHEIISGAVTDRREQRKLYNRLCILRLLMMEILNMDIQFGAGKFHTNPYELQNAFEEAQLAYNYRILNKGNGVVTYDKISCLSSSIEDIKIESLNLLEDAIERMNEENCRKALDNIFEEVSLMENLLLEQLKHISLTLLLQGIRKIPFV